MRSGIRQGFAPLDRRPADTDRPARLLDAVEAPIRRCRVWLADNFRDLSLSESESRMLVAGAVEAMVAGCKVDVRATVAAWRKAGHVDRRFVGDRLYNTGGAIRKKVTRE